MNDILLKVNEAIKNYYNKYERQPNTVLINEHDLNLLKCCLSPFFANDKNVYKIYGLKIMLIKYGEIQAVEVL